MKQHFFSAADPGVKRGTSVKWKRTWNQEETQIKSKSSTNTNPQTLKHDETSPQTLYQWQSHVFIGYITFSDTSITSIPDIYCKLFHVVSIIFPPTHLCIPASTKGFTKCRKTELNIESPQLCMAILGNNICMYECILMYVNVNERILTYVNV